MPGLELAQQNAAEHERIETAHQKVALELGIQSRA
jgi:hypothetical protein